MFKKPQKNKKPIEQVQGTMQTTYTISYDVSTVKSDTYTLKCHPLLSLNDLKNIYRKHFETVCPPNQNISKDIAKSSVTFTWSDQANSQIMILNYNCITKTPIELRNAIRNAIAKAIQEIGYYPNPVPVSKITS